MYDSLAAAGTTDAGRRPRRFAFVVALFKVGFLFVAVLAVQGQLAIGVTPETQTVDEGNYAYNDVALTARPDETVTVGMFRSSTKLTAPTPIPAYIHAGELEYASDGQVEGADGRRRERRASGPDVFCFGVGGVCEGLRGDQGR